MNHRASSVLLILLLVMIMVTVGYFTNFNTGMTGGTVAGSVVCEDNSDCDDGMKATEDICRNPGTEYSLCVNKPIEN